MFLDSTEIDFIVNGEVGGEIGEALGNVRFDPGLFRPYLDEKGNKCVTINSGKKALVKDSKGDVVFNSDGTPKERPIYVKRLVSDITANGLNLPCYSITNATTLRKDEWIRIDRGIQRAARQRLQAWADLAAASQVGGFDGLSTTIFEYEKANDPGEAIQDMDGLSEGRNDRATFVRDAIPLPITHSSFFMSSRTLAVSRRGGTPLDLFQGEAAARRVAEAVEKMTIGTTAFLYGASSEYVNASQVYGYTTHPDRVTKTDMTAPTGSNGTTVKSEFLAVRELLYAANFYGPFMVYVSDNYDQYLDDLFSTTEPSAGTLRENLLKIPNISGIKRLDYLDTDNVVIFVQMTSEVAQAINGMDVTTIQWETKGGMQMNFKTMAIQAPLLRSDANGNMGVAHATTA